jgi:N-hydroxyarylamine O-acetyltransferase
MTNTLPIATAADEWTIDALDLDAYLRRIGCVEPLTLDASTLLRLHRAHVASIPFENLDVIAGIGVSVELRCVQEKLVDAGRGGYCYEHGRLFAAALQRLGYRVRRLLARVGAGLSRPCPHAHGVAGDDRRRGLARRRRVRLRSARADPAASRSDREAGRVGVSTRLAGRGLLAVARAGSGAVGGRYAFGLERQHLSDIAVANHYASTSPSSPFVSQPVVVRKDDHAVRRLRGRQLSLVRGSGVVSERRIGDAELDHVLHELGLDIPARVRDAVRGWSAR